MKKEKKIMLDNKSLPYKVVEHPYLEVLLTTLRNKLTNPRLFRETITKMSLMMGLEAIKELPLVDREVETPFQKVVGRKIEHSPCLVSIFRAGNGMIEGLLDLFPERGHTGSHPTLCRFHLSPNHLYYKLSSH